VRTLPRVLALRLALLVTGASLLIAPAASAAVTREDAIRTALSVPAVRQELSKYDRFDAVARVEGDRYIVQLGANNEVRVEVDVDVLTGKVVRVYKGAQAAFPLARGPDSGFSTRKLNAIWIWLPMTLIFVGAFFDRRRPWRLLHFDLAAIAVLGVSFAYYMKGDLDKSVPLVYPTLVYALGRMLLAGLRPRQRAGPLTWLPARVVIGLTLALLALRIGLTLADTFVSDIGFASSAGADRILHGLELYTRGGEHFDTYGPLAYLLYIPFILIWPFNDAQAYPPSAEAAAIVWELITVAGLVVLGRRHALGWTLALAWTACPFTALAAATGTNDSLVAALLVWALVALRSPALSGALGGAAAAAKIAPGFVLPVLARGTGRLNLKRSAIYGGAALVVIAVSLVPLLPPGGLSEFYDATIGFQLHRDSPFSIWSQHPGLEPLQTLLKAASLGLALVLAVFPRGARSVGQMAALATAVLVAAEIPLQHWFYLYVPWFLPLYCLALFTERVAGARSAASQP
jgi:hypothetical protein